MRSWAGMDVSRTVNGCQKFREYITLKDRVEDKKTRMKSDFFLIVNLEKEEYKMQNPNQLFVGLAPPDRPRCKR